MSALYSLEELELMSDGDKEFIAKMKEIFEEEMLISLGKLDKALTEKDYETIRLTSHTMKPSIDNLAITSIRDEIRLVESLAAQKADVGILTPLVQKVDGVIREVIGDMKTTA